MKNKLSTLESYLEYSTYIQQRIDSLKFYGKHCKSNADGLIVGELKPGIYYLLCITKSFKSKNPAEASGPIQFTKIEMKNDTSNNFVIKQYESQFNDPLTLYKTRKLTNSKDEAEKE